jgi:hypothetical protein
MNRKTDASIDRSVDESINRSSILDPRSSILGWSIAPSRGAGVAQRRMANIARDFAILALDVLGLAKALTP